MKNYIIFSFYMFFIVNFHTAFGNEEDCASTPCDSYTKTQVIQRLWHVPPSMTYLGKKLAETMTDASRECDLSNCTLNTIFAQSLWPVEVYAGFHHDTLSISCVFEKILNLIVSETECQNDEFNQAIEDFITLSIEVVQFSKRTSLAVASCATIFPPPRQPRPEECVSGCSVNKFLVKYGSTLPPYLRDLIKYLNESPHVKDCTVAVILCALSRGPLNEFFQHILYTSEFLKSMQLKACLIPISECCCKFREEDFVKRADAVVPGAIEFLRGLMKN